MITKKYEIEEKLPSETVFTTSESNFSHNKTSHLKRFVPIAICGVIIIISLFTVPNIMSKLNNTNSTDNSKRYIIKGVADLANKSNFVLIGTITKSRIIEYQNEYNITEKKIVYTIKIDEMIKGNDKLGEIELPALIYDGRGSDAYFIKYKEISINKKYLMFFNQIEKYTVSPYKPPFNDSAWIYEVLSDGGLKNMCPDNAQKPTDIDKMTVSYVKEQVEIERQRFNIKNADRGSKYDNATLGNKNEEDYTEIPFDNIEIMYGTIKVVAYDNDPYRDPNTGKVAILTISILDRKPTKGTEPELKMTIKDNNYTVGDECFSFMYNGVPYLVTSSNTKQFDYVSSEFEKKLRN